MFYVSELYSKCTKQKQTNTKENDMTLYLIVFSDNSRELNYYENEAQACRFSRLLNPTLSVENVIDLYKYK